MQINVEKYRKMEENARKVRIMLSNARKCQTMQEHVENVGKYSISFRDEKLKDSKQIIYRN